MIRNTLLADVFYKAGFIESWGRGTIKIMEKCQEQALPEPDFEEEHGVFVVKFYQDKWNEENLKKLGINERQIKAVIYVKEKGKITNKEYQEINNCSRNTATNDLRRLVESHILKESGVKGAGSYYDIAQELHKLHSNCTRIAQIKFK